MVDAEADEDALAEELIAVEPIRPRVTEQRIATEPIRLTLITGLTAAIRTETRTETAATTGRVARQTATALRCRDVQQRVGRPRQDGRSDDVADRPRPAREDERTILAGRVALQRAATGDRAPAERRVGHIGLGFDLYVLISDTAANLSSSIPLHRNSIPAQRFTAGLISSSSNPRHSAAHWLAGRLATTHQLACVPHLQTRPLPIRGRVGLTLNRGV